MFHLGRWIIFCGWCLCVALTLLPGGQALAQPVKTLLPSDKEVVEIEGFGFPKQIAGLPRGVKVDYRSPGLGFSVLYGKPGETWADIYVYDKLLDLRSGSPITHAREELEAALGDVKTHVELGNYQRASIKDRSTSGSFAKAHLTIVQGGQERQSFVFITVHKGNFVKIRLTSNLGADARSLADRFLEGYRRALSTAAL